MRLGVNSEEACRDLQRQIISDLAKESWSRRRCQQLAALLFCLVRWSRRRPADEVGPFFSICSSAGSTASRDGRFCAAVLWENTNFAFKPKEWGTQSRHCSSRRCRPSRAPHVLPCPCTYTPAGLVIWGLESCPRGNVPPRLFWDRGRHLVRSQEGLLSASTLTQPGFSCRAPLVKAAEHSSKNWQLLSYTLSHDFAAGLLIFL